MHLVGWSMSGTAALAVAARHPELVRSVFVYEPSAASAVSDPAVLQTIGDDRRAAFAPVAGLVKAGDHAAAAKALVNGVNDQPDAFDRPFGAAARPIWLDNTRTLPLLLATQQPAINCEQLGRITVPVAVVNGDASRPFYRLIAAAVHRCTPGSQSIVVPQARHLWPLEEPTAFAQTLLAFLDGH